MKKIPGKKYWYAIVLIIVFIAFRVFRALFASETIDLVTVTKVDLVQETRVVGDVVAQEEALLGFGANGRIASLFFEVGDLVQEGELLARLDPQSSSAEYTLAEANVSRERTQLDDLIDGNRVEEVTIQKDLLLVQQQAVRVALQNVFQEVLNARSSAENAVRLKTDGFFREPEGYARLDFSAERKLRETIESERRDYDLLFKKWLEYNKTLSVETFDLESTSNYALVNLRRIDLFLTYLTQAASEASKENPFPDSLLQNLASARSGIDTQVDDLQDSLTAYQKSLTEEAKQKSEVRLVQAGATSGEIATQKARLQAEEARLQKASSSVFDTKITAPFTGTITESLYEVGETVNSGTGVIGLATLDRLEVQTFIPEVFIGDVTIGDKAFISLDSYPNRSIEAEVVSVDPKQTSRDGLATYKTVLTLSEVDDLILRLGMTSDITIITPEKKEVRALPLEYIVFENNQTYVYRKDGEIYNRIQIEVGIIDPQGRQEIISGLEVGDSIKKHE